MASDLKRKTPEVVTTTRTRSIFNVLMFSDALAALPRLVFGVLAR
jgi:hypothetical protein